MMGPYFYKTVLVTIGTFSSADVATSRIQASIDEHVADGWELFEFRPVPLAMTWKWNVLIFRKPTS